MAVLDRLVGLISPAAALRRAIQLGEQGKFVEVLSPADARGEGWHFLMRSIGLREHILKAPACRQAGRRARGGCNARRRMGA